MNGFLQGVASRRISCSRVSMRWLAMNKSKQHGFHVIWLAPSIFRSKGLELTEDGRVIEPILFDDSKIESSSVSICKTKKRLRKVTYQVRLGNDSVVICRANRPSDSWIIKYKHIENISIISNLRSCSFYVDIQMESTKKQRRVMFEGSSFNEVSTLRQVLFARVTANKSSFRRRKRTKTEDDSLIDDKTGGMKPKVIVCDNRPLHKTV